MKTTKKIITLVLALALIFALAAPSFAIVSGAPSSYTQVPLANAPTETGTFQVYLTIISYSRDNKFIGRYKIPVDMGTDGVTKTYYVSEVLANAGDQYDELTFYSTTYNVVTGSSSYIYGVKDTTADSAMFDHLPLLADFQGWAFRINDLYPVLNSANWPSGYTADRGPLGATINQAYVTHDQTITLYYAIASNVSYVTKYNVINSVDYDSDEDTLTIDMVASTSYYDSTSPYYWHIGDYFNVPTNQSFYVYVNDTPYSAVASNGTLTIVDDELPIVSGTNYITVTPVCAGYTYNNVQYGVPMYTGGQYILTA